jgi:hypothetical protein
VDVLARSNQNNHRLIIFEVGLRADYFFGRFRGQDLDTSKLDIFLPAGFRGKLWAADFHV